MQSSATKVQRILPSSEIRKTFIDYFVCNHDHKFIRSSPVVPFCDASVAFVNAGMNQFKSIFLGKSQPTYPRVTNSQKCVRVGGKHNDLTVVGQDGYHHTFFEMLGNWSFGDYFKRNACEYALELLRGPYNIEPSRLYVTYFAGDKVLGLPADLECLEIWRSLGFPSERILPFGSKDNFWEMGSTGPCGPCTEIHIDHLPGNGNGRTVDRAKLVNAGSPDLTELWNLVFIQYNRNEDGTISKLPAHHVDTGMGFERLTAILQHKTSNYDTDLFTPIFDTIQKATKAPTYEGRFPSTTDLASLDTSYRILADHARMVTACLADGMLPDQNQKLRRVLRKAFNVGESVFGNDRLLSQLVPVVVETLGSAYPEMTAKQRPVLELIDHELEVYKILRSSSAKAFAEIITDFPNLVDMDELIECPGFVPAYREFQSQKQQFANNTIHGKFLFKLTDTYGLTEDNFEKLAELEDMVCDLDGYRKELRNAKLRSKTALRNSAATIDQIVDIELTKLTRTLPPTDDSYKYQYAYEPKTSTYHIPSLQTQVTGLVLKDKIVDEINLNQCRDPSALIYIATQKSNFYCESGGQESDRGRLQIIANGSVASELEVLRVESVNGNVVHVCKLPENCKDDFLIRKGTTIELNVDSEHRQLNICHHTATHLLNATIRDLFKKVTYQVSSSVTRDSSKLELGLIGQRITKEDIARVEDIIGRVICSASPVQVDIINAADVLQQNDITMVPGEIYPETGLRLITICSKIGSDPQVLSKELCCGTHVTNTREIEYFCITNVKQTNRARYAFTAVAGKAAENVLKAAALIRHRVDGLEQQFQMDKLTNATEVELQQIRHQIIHGSITLPFAFKLDTVDRINEILKKLKDTTRLSLKEFVEVEMKNLLQEKPALTHPFIVHYISSSALVEEVPLQRATKVCPDRPILVVGMCDGVVKARCCVPSMFVTASFDAEKWLNEFAAIFKAQVSAPRNQSASQVCNMKGRKVTTQFDEQLEEAMERAEKFAAKHLL